MGGRPIAAHFEKTVASFQFTPRNSPDETASALTPLMGAVFEFSKAQVGFYWGWNLINGVEKDVWIYQGKPWFSIGVATSIFNGGSDASLGGLGDNTQ